MCWRLVKVIPFLLLILNVYQARDLVVKESHISKLRLVMVLKRVIRIDSVSEILVRELPEEVQRLVPIFKLIRLGSRCDIGIVIVVDVIHCHLLRSHSKHRVLPGSLVIRVH